MEDELPNTSTEDFFPGFLLHGRRKGRNDSFSEVTVLMSKDVTVRVIRQTAKQTQEGTNALFRCTLELPIMGVNIHYIDVHLTPSRLKRIFYSFLWKKETN